MPSNQHLMQHNSHTLKTLQSHILPDLLQHALINHLVNQHRQHLPQLPRRHHQQILHKVIGVQLQPILDRLPQHIADLLKQAVFEWGQKVDFADLFVLCEVDEAVPADAHGGFHVVELGGWVVVDGLGEEVFGEAVGEGAREVDVVQFLEEVEGHLRGDLHEVDGALHQALLEELVDDGRAICLTEHSDDAECVTDLLCGLFETYAIEQNLIYPKFLHLLQGNILLLHNPMERQYIPIPHSIIGHDRQHLQYIGLKHHPLLLRKRTLRHIPHQQAQWLKHLPHIHPKLQPHHLMNNLRTDQRLLMNQPILRYFLGVGRLEHCVRAEELQSLNDTELLDAGPVLQLSVEQVGEFGDEIEDGLFVLFEVELERLGVLFYEGLEGVGAAGEGVTVLALECGEGLGAELLGFL